ncbi:MAG: hypothetical protein ACKPFF_16065, partial [Planktothrix sp.]
MLNFKRTSEDLKIVTIHDGYGSSIDIPSRGYVDSVEYSSAMDIILKASDEGSLSTVEQRLVTLLLALRFKLDKNISPEKLLIFDDGSSIGAPLLKALYNHFLKELGAEEGVLKFPFGNYRNLTSKLDDSLSIKQSKRSKKS